jgi:hypothetical protein
MRPWLFDTQVKIAAAGKYSMGERWRNIDAGVDWELETKTARRVDVAREDV